MTHPLRRRPLHRPHRWVPWLLLLLLPGANAVAAMAWQSHEDIRATAVAAARRAVADRDGAARLEAARPDPRLRLPACERPLDGAVSRSSGGATQNRMLAEVRCAGARPWRLYVPVTLRVVRPVVVATRTLARDSILAPDDIGLAEREVTGLAAGYLTDPGQLVGQRLRRGVAAGAIVGPAALDAAVLIRRGQQVSLEARSGGIEVRMAGVARRDGALGQVIPVENVSSGRVLEGVVRSEKAVEVLLR